MSEPISDHVSTHEPVVSPRAYLLVYIILMALLALTIGLSYIDFGRHWNNLAALLIAVAKAVLIGWFFMHLGYGPRLTLAFAVAGFLWLAIMITLTMSDYLTRNHPPGDSPRGEPRYFVEPGQK